MRHEQVGVGDGWAAARELLAFPLRDNIRTRLVPAQKGRPWIPATEDNGPRWCLPLLLANSAGWELRTPVGVTAEWAGGSSIESLRVAVDGDTDMPPSSVFGRGVLTFSVPFLFRTARGTDLLVRGPANWPKDGVSPLEGLVATDWSVSTFTMNWQMTRPGTVRWEADEPVCMLVPQERAALEDTTPRWADLSRHPQTRGLVAQAAEQRVALRKRTAMLALANLVSVGRHEFERVYYRGRYPDGRRAPVHRAALRLRPFSEAPEQDETDSDSGSGEQS